MDPPPFQSSSLEGYAGYIPLPPLKSISTSTTIRDEPSNSRRNSIQSMGSSSNPIRYDKSKTIACELCRYRRVRCVREEPGKDCGFCIKKKLICITTPRPGYSPPNQQLPRSSPALPPRPYYTRAIRSESVIPQFERYSARDGLTEYMDTFARITEDLNVIKRLCGELGFDATPFQKALENLLNEPSQESNPPNPFPPQLLNFDASMSLEPYLPQNHFDCQLPPSYPSPPPTGQNF